MNDFITHKQSDNIQFIFPSTLESIDIAINYLKIFLAENSVPFDPFELIYIIRESLNNAIIHGNKKNPDLKVEFCLSFRDNKIEIKITDEGSGFNWRDQLSKKTASHKATSGRGLQTIAQYGYTIKFNETGNILYLSK